MIVEAINRLLRLGDEARKFPVQTLPGDRPGRFFIQDADGKLEFFDREPGDKVIRSASIADLVRNAMEPIDARHMETDSMIVYGMAGAELFFDLEKGGASMSWQGDLSREFELFRGWRNNAIQGIDGVGIRLHVHEAVPLFDTLLRQTIPSPDWIDQISKLEIQQNEQMQAAQDATSSLAGGLVKKEVTTDLPTGEVTFNVRVLTDTSFNRLPLKCYIRADLDNRCWAITPIEDSWYDLIEAQTKAVRTRLEAAEEHVSDIVRGEVDWMTTN